METTIRRISPLSVFKIAFVLYGLIGLVMAFFYCLMFFFLSQLGSSSMGPEMTHLFRVGSGVGAIALFFLSIVFALFYALFAAGVTTLGAIVYNVLAGSVGGIRVTLVPGPEGGPVVTIPPYVPTMTYGPPGTPAPQPGPYPPGPYPPQGGSGPDEGEGPSSKP